MWEEKDFCLERQRWNGLARVHRCCSSGSSSSASAGGW